MHQNKLNKFDLFYQQVGKELIKEGVWIKNPRTGVRCLTGRTQVFTMDSQTDDVPVVTSRRVPFKPAIMESVGYLQGLTNAKAFSALSVNTWFKNANENEAWLNNPNRDGEDDMGFVYGAIGHDFGGINQFLKVIDHLSNGIDDRGEIITFWKPDEFDRGCLRPCLHTYKFNLIDGVLDLTANQRSCDWPLGCSFNCLQVYFMLKIIARITGNKMGRITWVIDNPHVYENQYETFCEQMERELIPCSPVLGINPEIETWDDLMNVQSVNDMKIKLDGYKNHAPLKYEMTA